MRLLSTTLLLALAAGLPAPAAAQAEALLGEWLGSYVCGQGHTGMRLAITSAAGTRLAGEFAFFALPDNPAVPSGRYLVKGSFDPAGGAVTLDGVRWLEQPQDYVMVGLDGTLDPTGEVISGAIDTAPCTAFKVRRQDAAGAR